VPVARDFRSNQRLNATSVLMRLLNRSAILDLIRDNDPISRSEIARRLNISTPTVIRIVENLIEEGLVIDEDCLQPSGGRPRSLVSFNAKGHAVIGIDLGGTKMFGTIADLGGNIQTELYLPWEDVNPDPDESLQQLFTLIDRLLETPKLGNQLIRGIGVGAPGVTLYPDGIVTWAPSLGWRDLPLQDILHERYKLPVKVENDVNLAALGEYGFGVGKSASSLVCLAVGTGIGAGIVINRQIFRGAHQSAGEIGYLLPGINFVGQRFDTFGALEGLASGSGVSKRAGELLKQKGIVTEPSHPTSEEVFNYARAAEPWAQQIVDETIDYLCLAIGAISSLLDPEIIILGGGVSRSADLLIEPILQKLDGAVPTLPHLVPSSLGYRAAVMGAIMLILDFTTDHVTVN
jgi:predicted NBD/HSP70 family sugar kinase